MEKKKKRILGGWVALNKEGNRKEKETKSVLAAELEVAAVA